ncbi:hypothetical protein [Massilia sp. HP4]|uniref:hypothetical protein n=1 Tax=Massilia sp. HP4 TaxID=2562316 RepID=UPI0010C023AF|nr:hypothetical protein [Massilia sp. HP4]
MKKPGSGRTSDQKGGSKMTPQVIGKALDVAHGLVGVGNSLIGLASERERTLQVQWKAAQEIETSRQKTEQVQIAAQVDIARLLSDDRADIRAHELAMTALRLEEKKLDSVLRQQEQVLERILDSADSQAQLVASYSALLNGPERS